MGPLIELPPLASMPRDASFSDSFPPQTVAIVHRENDIQKITSLSLEILNKFWKKKFWTDIALFLMDFRQK